MKILIEEFPYPADTIRPYIAGLDPLTRDKKTIRINHVGYCYNHTVKDCVFFLPKVVLNGGSEGYSYNSVFNNINPLDIIDLEHALKNRILTAEQYNFIYGLSVWIYRAINVYRKNNADDNITRSCEYSLMNGTTANTSCTFLDIILSIIDFNAQNQNFFMFTMKNMHCGNSKINWRKTVSSQVPILTGYQKSVIYMDTVSRKKIRNFDEELLIIFFSILNHLNKTYGFHAPINFNYDLITGTEYDRYEKRYGKIRLQQIKHRYFNDKALKIWNLCHSYFTRTNSINSSRRISDYLLVKDFNIVFENIIDHLIGDHNLDKGLQRQYDGKIVDHIYSYPSLVSPDNIYYIGDSKYYKAGNSLGKKSVFKQFTYARNVIQYNLDILYKNSDSLTSGESAIPFLPYRDSITEGYNITPNFFISADLPRDYSYKSDRLTKRSSTHRTFQFPNRLFDRDTMWLTHYNVNFLYILSLYAVNSRSEILKFREQARKTLRDGIIDLYNDKYDFYQPDIHSHEEFKNFADKHFRLLIGKMFSFNNIFLIALEKGLLESDVIKTIIESEIRLSRYTLQ